MRTTEKEKKSSELEKGIPDESKPLLDEDNSEKSHFQLSLAALGPAIVCCLADGDAGSIMVAAQSGAKWKYSFILVQVLLIPVMFAMLDALVRIAISEKQGFGAMVRQNFGSRCAIFSMCLLLVSCFGAIISQMSGVSAVATLWGLPKQIAPGLTAALVLCIVVCFNHRQVELVAMAFGLCELSFVGMLAYFRPSMHELVSGAFSFQLGDIVFWRVLAANIGSVLMPWMIYFFQSAVVAKRIRPGSQEASQEKAECLLGSIVTQAIMISVMIVLAASGKDGSLKSVSDIENALEPFLGPLWTKVLLSCALCGGSVCALFVVALAASWAICDTLGQDPEDSFSLDKGLFEAPRFYCSFAGVVVVGMFMILISPDVIRLNVYIELLNALMFPLALYFLFAFVTGPKIQEGLQIVGVHKFLLQIIFGLTATISLASGIIGLTEEHTYLED